MRTFRDWRDLPPIPRVGGKNAVDAPQSSQCAAPPCAPAPVTPPAGRPRAENHSETTSSDSDEEIIVPRKRARHGANAATAGSHIYQESRRHDLPAEERPADTASSGNAVRSADSAREIDDSKHRTGSPVSEGDTTIADTDDSSDEEAVLRVIRRRRKHGGTGRSCNRERPSSSKDRRLYQRDDTDGCSASQRDRQRPSAAQSKKRRRSTSSQRDFKDDRKDQKRQRTDRAVSRTRGALEESLLAESSPVSGCNRGQASFSGGSGRRRCARRSTGSVTVPWYLLDEERRPRRLRSSSRNYAARCVYWTRTEHRLFYIAKSPIHNRGLYVREDIPAFAPVIEYAGEVITQVQSEIREWAYQTRHMDEVYMYQLRKGTTNVIDGTSRGGPAKFVNHSCEPNVVAEEIYAGGTNRVWFFSLRPIRKDEEILVDYCLSYEAGDVKRPCKCRARNCKKFLNYYGLTE